MTFLAPVQVAASNARRLIALLSKPNAVDPAPTSQMQNHTRPLNRLLLNSLVMTLCSVVVAFSVPLSTRADDLAPGPPFDVLHYNITIEPDIAGKTLKGNVVIRFVANVDNLFQVEFDCGNLQIDSVTESGVARDFALKDHRLQVILASKKARQITEIEISYHGAPKNGIRFIPEGSQVYTVFSTSQWTVCNDAPDDKATLSLTLILPATLTPLSNGRLVSKRELTNKRVASTWEQKLQIPTYTFGFAAGPYRLLTEKKHGVEFQYLTTSFSDKDVHRIFQNTPDMLEFYENRSGVRYPDKTYAQVLAAGGVEQEMSSFTALNESYGKEVLANEQDLWLGAHEFAHQWWGNMVTCRNWNHFWLNEGIASFMAAAYMEHRFGSAVYLREIESYRASYERVRSAGKDKSLVFADWLHPTREDRTLVYDKGAYVMHLLRKEMGERAFWKGIRIFTRRYFGKSVVTADFKAAMEEANGKSLDAFFARWVYLEG
jgi:aminopeptidase N